MHRSVRAFGDLLATGRNVSPKGFHASGSNWASILVCELSCSTSEVIYEARRFKDLLIGVKHFTTYGLRPYILRGRSLGFLATCFSKVRVALCAWWREEQAGLGGALA